MGRPEAAAGICVHEPAAPGSLCQRMRQLSAATVARPPGVHAADRTSMAAAVAILLLMPPSLVIVESPGKTRKINTFLGRGYLVRASLGHVRDLPDGRGSRPAPGRGRQSAPRPRGGSGLGIDIAAGWRPVWAVPPDKERTVSELRKAGSDGVVYLATDLDREGEAIAWHLAELLGGPADRFRRVTFTEITEAAVRGAFESPRRLDLDLVHAQLARRFLDRVVGFELSPLLCRRLGAQLSAGRVQSAALQLLVARDDQIRVFSAAPFHTLLVRLPLAEGAAFEARVVDTEGGVRRFDDSGEADRLVELLGRAAYEVVSLDVAQQTQRPRPPFVTSTLQQAASSRLGLSVSDTMSAAQALYEAGLITYMRTDAQSVAPEAADAARAWITAAFGPSALPDKPPTYAARAGAQEAHEAIRPTAPGSVDVPADAGASAAALYDLIRRRFLASQMAPARLRRLTWKLSASTAPDLPLAAVGRQLVDAGFHRVLPPESVPDDPPFVGDVSEGRRWEAGEADVERVDAYTKPPPRFTEATLVAELERHGVGRPSTYAAILRTIVSRGYVLVDRRVFVVTPIGRLVAHHVQVHFPNLVDLGFTASVEAELDQVAAGELDYLDFLGRFYGPFHASIEAASAAPDLNPPDPVVLGGSACSSCREPLILRLVRRDLAAVCPRCRVTVPLEWAPRRGRRSRAASAPESRDGAAVDQAAADQRAQSRCGRCRGAQARWRIPDVGTVDLCQAWPLCGGVRFEAAAARAGARKSASSAKPAGRSTPRSSTSRSSTRGPRRPASRR